MKTKDEKGVERHQKIKLKCEKLFKIMFWHFETRVPHLIVLMTMGNRIEKLNNVQSKPYFAHKNNDLEKS